MPIFVLGERVAAGPVDDREHVVVLVDHLHRHEALARVGQRDRHRSGIEVEHTRRIKRVAIGALDDVVVDRRQLAVVVELAEAALRDEAGKDRSVSARMKLSAVTGTRSPAGLRSGLRLRECRSGDGEQHAAAV